MPIRPVCGALEVPAKPGLNGIKSNPVRNHLSESDAYERRVDAYYSELEDLLSWELADKNDEPFWRWIASRGHPGAILEVGCGAGRVTRLLARRGVPVLAVDLSPNLLRRAGERVSACSNVQLARADFRLLPTARRFGLVVAADDPFSHMVEEWRRAESFESVADRLELGGTMILDALWFPETQREIACGPGGLKKEHACNTDHGRLRIKETWELEAGTNECRAAYEYKLGDEVARRVEFAGRVWTHAEVRWRCESCQLRVNRCWGNYRRDPWEPGTSTRLIFEAVRTE